MMCNCVTSSLTTKHAALGSQHVHLQRETNSHPTLSSIPGNSTLRNGHCGATSSPATQAFAVVFWSCSECPESYQCHRLGHAVFSARTGDAPGGSAIQNGRRQGCSRITRRC